jgi:perosamine synthetase
VGAPYAISVASCTAGLHLAYFHKKIGAGDEVIVPAQSHVATAHAVELSGAKPIFVDAETQTGNMDLDAVEEAITSKTKAISVVHYLGMPVDMAKLMRLAASRGLWVVEDCALALGSRIDGVHAGLHGDLGAFSFYPVKHITTAEGGMVVTKHASVQAGMTLEKAFGVDRTPSERVVPGMYDVVALGFNYRMNEIEAALGIEQMKRLPSFLATRRENYQHLSNGLRQFDEIRLLGSTTSRLESSYYCHSILLQGTWAQRRTEVLNALKEQGVGVSVYYPQAIPHFQYYRDKYGYSESSFPNAATISATSIALPVGPHLGVREMDQIVEALKRAFTKLRR